MRGRKPIPTALKILRGNPGKRPLNPDEPMPEALAERCPPELAAGEARREWKRTIVPAIRRGQVTAADRACAIAHCVLWSLWCEEIDTATAVLEPPVSEAALERLAAARRAAQNTLRLLLTVDSELGLTPVSRSRVKATPPAAAAAPSKWAGLLA